MKKTGVIYVDPQIVDDMEKFCREPPGWDNCNGKDVPLFDEEFVFDNGIRMAIQVCPSTEPDKEECWCQSVLFSLEGVELGCTDVGESLLGESYLEHDGVEYIVDVRKDQFVIRCPKTGLYWSNEWGWGTLEGCERFDTKNWNLPLEGEWQKLSEAKEVEDE